MQKRLMATLILLVLAVGLISCSVKTEKTPMQFQDEKIEEITETSPKEGNIEATEEPETEIPPVVELESHYEQMTAEELLADRNGIKPEDGYRTLQEIELLTDKFVSGSIDFGVLDKEENHEGFASAFVPVNMGTFVIREWNTTDLSAYLENGYISMYIKGEKGGETFEIGLQDCDRDRQGENDSVTSFINSKDFVGITTEWQQVVIPLADFFKEEIGLDISCIWTVKIGRAEGKIKMANVRIASPDTEKSESRIKVNQLGYGKQAEKYAYVSGFYEDLLCNSKTTFSIKDSLTDDVVYRGFLTLECAYDENYSGETIYKADFSDYTISGEYYLEVEMPQPLISPVFNIGNNVYSNVIGTLCKYYYYQRANVPLKEEYAGVFAREALYEQDRNMAFLSDPSKKKNVSGGWFDAGDFGKYVDTGAVAVIELLWAYKLFPDVFADHISCIPESGNGISDLLDEIKIELSFILKMQDKDGGFYHRVKPDDNTRAIVDTFYANDGGNIKSTGTTANAVAALSLAYTVFYENDKGYAEMLLDSAKKGWQYIMLHPDIASEGTYGTKECKSQLFYAACAMYYATSQDTYHDYIKSHYKDFVSAYTGSEVGHSYSNMKRIAYATYLACENTDKEIRDYIAENFAKWKKEVLKTAENNPWKTPLADWAFWWGSNINALTTCMEMYITEYFLDGNTFDSRNLTTQTVYFIYGINPLGKSFVTGIGQNCIERTYSGIFGEDEINEFPPGYTPGGINHYDGEIISRFPLRCYTDTAVDWVTNENAIYYQSALVFATAMQTDM